MKDCIFPKTDIRLSEYNNPKGDNYYLVQMISNIRLKHEEKYYLTMFVRDSKCNNYTEICKAISEMFQLLVKYKENMKVSTELRHYTGDLMFKLDENQDD